MHYLVADSFLIMIILTSSLVSLLHRIVAAGHIPVIGEWFMAQSLCGRLTCGAKHPMPE
jgi:hypothetical protein